MLLSVRSTSLVAHPPLNIAIRNAQVKSNKFLIDFQETTSNPVVGFILLSSTNVNLKPLSAWEQELIPYFLNVPQPGWKRFEAPYNPAVPRRFYIIKALIQN